jgi:hypothetical protein
MKRTTPNILAAPLSVFLTGLPAIFGDKVIRVLNCNLLRAG